MARPIKNGSEKAIQLYVSCSPEEKVFLDKKGISPSQLFQQAINNFRVSIGERASTNELEKDIEILRKYFVASTKPNGDVKKYWLAVDMFLQKFPDWTKAEVMQRAERPRHVVLEEPKQEGEVNVL
jgi:hypothetical protein